MKYQISVTKQGNKFVAGIEATGSFRLLLIHHCKQERAVDSLCGFRDSQVSGR